MKTTNYSLVEQETIYRYDAVDRMWYAWSCIPRHIAALQRQGWELVKQTEDGAEFKAPVYALKPGKAQKRQLTDDQRASLAQRLKTHRNQAESAAKQAQEGILSTPSEDASEVA